jgi:hypothetical protein
MIREIRMIRGASFSTLAQVSYHEAGVLEFAGIGFKRHYKVGFI